MPVTIQDTNDPRFATLRDAFVVILADGLDHGAAEKFGLAVMKG